MVKMVQFKNARFSWDTLMRKELQFVFFSNILKERMCCSIVGRRLYRFNAQILSKKSDTWVLFLRFVNG